MVNKSISINNAWNMLKTLYKELNGRKFKGIDITGIEEIDSLYSLIIARWCASLAKEGLYKEYITIEDEEMSSPRGQINVQESISRQTMMRGTLVCSYDELSEDIYINHVIKGTLQYLLVCDKVSKEQKLEIQKTMQMFNGVSYVDITKVHWADIKFNSSNIRYKHLLEICKTLISEHRVEQSLGLNDDKRLFILFKKQLYPWLASRYGAGSSEEMGSIDTDIVEPYEKPFIKPELESPVELAINKVQKMVIIRTEEMALVICIRLIDEMILDDNKLYRMHEDNFAYHLRDYETEFKVKTSGCILYVNTDRNKLNLEPITVSEVGGHYMIGTLKIDIHDQWRFIINKIENVYKYFIERTRNKRKAASLQK